MNTGRNFLQDAWDTSVEKLLDTLRDLDISTPTTIVDSTAIVVEDVPALPAPQEREE